MDTSPAPALSDMSRVTVVAPRVRLDVAVPADVPLAALLPTLLLHTGEQVIEAGAAHGGWALQRLGEAPLDTARSCAQLGVLDGDVLYFRPRGATAPELVFDDPVDGIATILRDRARRWNPAATRRCALTALALIPQTALLPLLTAGPDHRLPAVAAGAVALALLLVAAALSRAVGDSVAGAFAGVAAVPFAAVAGLLAPLGTGALGTVGAAHLATASASAFAASILGAWFVGVGTVAGEDKPLAGSVLLTPAVATAVIGASTLGALRWDAAGCAALAAALALAFSVLIPRIAYRAAGLPPAMIAVSAADLREQSKPLPTATLTQSSLTADRVVTALVAGTALAVAGCTAFGLTGPGWTPPVLAAVVIALLALRARLFGGAAQRWWLIGAALALAVPTAVVVAERWPRNGIGTAVVLGVALAATAVVGRVAVRPEQRFAPAPARWADLLELAGVMAAVPLALLMLGTFGYFRSLGG